ncbi:hypothetical protein MANI_111637 [Metarhizium anisopliae]|nr:hypothetical protein MANI_111637 [Metarhizium anisopliae]
MRVTGPFCTLLYANIRLAIANKEPQLPIHNTADACPDYASYASYPHKPLSTGPLALPFQRPERRCRTFHSDEIERVITDITTRMKDPDLARLFENAFPSTTDTTIKFHNKGRDTGFVRFGGSRTVLDDGAWQGHHSFIITGDIIAEWLRDSTNQLRPYQTLAKKDPAIFDLILGAINTQAEYVIEAPYCNAFQPPPISDLPITSNGQDDVVHPAYEPSAVFECKYELDSLAHFLALANDFYEHTGSTDFLNNRWYLAVETLLQVLEEQSKPTFDPETGDHSRNEYTFQRRTSAGTETLSLQGNGNPLNSGTGLIRSAFRPSDDATILGFFIPANAMMSVELRRTSKFLKASNKASLAEKLEKWGGTLRSAVWEHGVVTHAKYGQVFAYEVDGYGSAIVMDDANYPSLLALPLMGFCGIEDPIYKNTRKMILEKLGNPYYLKGKDFEGIGVPEDDEGIDLVVLQNKIRELEQDEQAKPQLKPVKPHDTTRKLYRHVVYIVPTCANPSGKTMSLRRREELVHLARDHNALVVCDDVYDFLQWSVDPEDEQGNRSDLRLPRLCDIERSLGFSEQDPDKFGYTVSNGSFSKIAGPGVRTGWVEASSKFVIGLGNTASTLSGGAPSQLCAAILGETLRTGELQKHIARTVCPSLQRRYKLAMTAIHQYITPLGYRARETSLTGARIYGGYFIWLSPKAELSLSSQLVADVAMEEENLAIGYGCMFEVHGDDGSAPFKGDIRICFAWEAEDAIIEGIQRLGSLLKRMLENPAQYENWKSKTEESSSFVHYY